MYHKRYDNGGGLFQSSESGFLGGEPQVEKKEEVVSVSETATPESTPVTTPIETEKKEETFLGIPLGSSEKKMFGKYEIGSDAYYEHLGRIKDRKYYNPAEKWERAYGKKTGRKKPRYNKFTEGGGMDDYSGNYYSTNDFVGTHNLQELANRLFGMGWEAEDDVSQIQQLIESMGGGYIVTVPSDRSEWQEMMSMYNDTLLNKTGDSNYDIFVISESDYDSMSNENDEEEYANGGGVGSGYNYYLVTLFADDRDYNNQKTFDIQVISDSKEGAGRKAKQIVQYEDSNYVYKKETYKLSVKNIKKLGAVNDINKNIAIDSKEKSYLKDGLVLTIELNGGYKYGYCKYSIKVAEVNSAYKYSVYDDDADKKVKVFNDFHNALLYASIKIGYKLKPYDKSIRAGERAKDVFDMGGNIQDSYDYSSGLTDEDMVKENLVNGEISCSILREIIGCDPEYPSQIVGSIKLTKCFLRPYYKIG